MKKVFISVLIASVSISTSAQTSVAQVPAIPAQPAVVETPVPEQAAAAPAEAAASTVQPAQVVKKAAVAKGTSVAKPKAAAVPSPWSGLAIADVTRATDINDSRILDAENPTKRIDYSALLIGQIKYKMDAKNKFSATQAVSKDLVRNPVTNEDSEFKLKTLRLGWTRSTDATILGSGAIALPFSVALPTTEAARLGGMIASFRFKPSITWEINPTYSLNFTSENNFGFSSPPTEEYAYSNIIEKATYKASQLVTASANLSDWVSISQTVGTSSSAKNLKNILGMEQVGSAIELSTGVSFATTPELSIDLAVNQSAPLQGNGNDATKVYDNNLFRLYHVAQTSYEVAATYAF